MHFIELQSHLSPSPLAGEGRGEGSGREATKPQPSKLRAGRFVGRHKAEGRCRRDRSLPTSQVASGSAGILPALFDTIARNAAPVRANPNVMGKGVMRSLRPDTRLPRTGPARRALQETGQFWTPDWVAEAMAAFVLAGKPDAVFDPAVGAGAFFKACRKLGFTGSFKGFEPDADALAVAQTEGLSSKDLKDVVHGDFLHSRPGRHQAILSNPPYLRHHRISAAVKVSLRFELRRSVGVEIDGRAGLHVYFLIWCLKRLAPGGRLAFILPADTCEGVFAGPLWAWATQKFRLHAIVTFSPEASPFPGVDTNAFVVAMENAPPRDKFVWSRLDEPSGRALASMLVRRSSRSSSATIPNRDISEALDTGFTRPPRSNDSSAILLGDVAQVRRGIATGANEFFFLTKRQLRERGLHEKWFIRAIGRTRDCPGDFLDEEQLETLDAAERPTYLLNLPDSDPGKFPRRLRDYLAEGARNGYPERPLIKSRKVWFRSEQRQVPPILFAYLGRRACRFIRNRTGVVPLTGFLCVYSNPGIGLSDEKLWRLLNEEETLEGLASVGKSYGSGAIKVEPRALERLPLPHAVCNHYGLEMPAKMKQMRLLENRSGYKVRGEVRKTRTLI